MIAAPQAPPLQAATPAAPGQLAKRAEVAKTAEAFEAAFLSVMLKTMFEQVSTSAPFGGGPGEDAFKSFLTDAFAKQMAKGGGVGLADPVAREMLKLQGLE